MAPEGHAALTDLQYNWLTRTVPKLATILVVPNVRPSQDRVIHHDGDCGDDHCVQAPRHECCLESARTRVQDEELLKGVLEGGGVGGLRVGVNVSGHSDRSSRG